MIEEFTGDHRWLSNFARLDVPLVYEDISYPTVEHFYASMKTLDIDSRNRIVAEPNPGNVKRMGNRVILRKNWDMLKTSVMLVGLNHKFSIKNPRYRLLLINTGDKYIQEGNLWNDRYWGFCLKSKEGKNRLGHMIMNIRSQIMNSKRSKESVLS